MRGVATECGNVMVTADFDGDGKLDFAASGETGIRVYFGLGEEGFSAPTIVHVGAPIHSLLAADLNHDGLPDLVADSRETEQYRVFLGSAGRTFVAGDMGAAGDDPSEMVAGDWNEDGYLDLAISCRRQTQPFRLLLNDGSGRFTAMTSTFGSFNSDNIAATDFNRDGHQDLIVDYAHGVNVYYGDGQGGFALGPGIATRTQVDKIVAGDLNGDSLPDLITNAGPILQNAQGGLSFVSREFGFPMAVVDQNLDGKLDIIGKTVGNKATLQLGDGSGGFGDPTLFEVGGFPFGTAVGDFDGDGVPDALFATSDQNIILATGHVTSGFLIPANILSRLSGGDMAIADLNGDHLVDLVQAGGTRLQIQLALAGGGYEAAETTPAVGSSVQLVDVNEDRRLDVVISGEVRLGQGGGAFGAPSPLPVGRQPGTVRAGDFTGDGHLDLAVVNWGGGSVSLLIGDGVGNFSAGTTLTGFTVPSGLSLNDLNGDGSLDLIVADYTRLFIYPGSQAGFGAPLTLTLPNESSSRALAVADLNKDGFPDLVCVGQGVGPTGKTLVYFGNGNGTTPVPQVLDNRSSVGLQLVDLDADGNLDIVTAGGSSRTHMVYLGDGNGAFRRVSDVTAGGFSDTPSVVVVYDFNGDGKLDLASPGGNVARTNFYYRR